MEKREEALREALARNADETTRWETYLRENEQAIENLDAFSKRLVVDVMVPVGRKAFTPGQLIHTNEVMVGHYQGYFSKCAAHTAKQICEQRIRMAKQRLEALTTEADLWSNKLEKPYLDGVLPNEYQQEIIEEYDEEKEKRWREEHKLRVKQAKLREKEEMQKEIEAKEKLEAELQKSEANEKEIKDEDVALMLEKAEMLEEQENELDKLEVAPNEDTEEMLRKLMSGKMKLPPPKPRIAHEKKLDDGEIKFPNILPGVVKKSELPAYNIPPTNNNCRVNPELLLQQALTAQDNGNESDDSESSEPEEIQIIEGQAKFLPTSDRIGFYQYQLQIIEQKILTSKLANAEDIEQKLHLFKVRERLEELLEMAEEIEGAAKLAASDEINEETSEALSDTAADIEEVKSTEAVEIPKSQQKRRISFATEDHTLEFRKYESVAQMLPKEDITQPAASSPPKRDIITLEGFEHLAKQENIKHNDDTSPTSIPIVVDKKQQILNKVEESLRNVTETQSTQDFDLVNKIIANSDGLIRTLHISFKHSIQSAENSENKTDSGDAATDSIPGSPADIYRMFMQSAGTDQSEKQPSTLFIDSFEGEDQLKVPVLKEQDRQEAFKDPRSEFSNPIVQKMAQNSANAETKDDNANIKKSILRNKSAVETETRASGFRNQEKGMNKENTNKKARRKKPPKQLAREEEYMSAYNKVMQDVVEKVITEPEPLPSGRYIDAHAPKQRVSRFKQMRGGVEKT